MAGIEGKCTDILRSGTSAALLAQSIALEFLVVHASKPPKPPFQSRWETVVLPMLLGFRDPETHTPVENCHSTQWDLEVREMLTNRFSKALKKSPWNPAIGILCLLAVPALLLPYLER
jgi:hypothetical protein